ncbi:MAG: hypothetical protein LBG62_07305 [Candidatus Methanoplasma sp.]|jgi:hypothetical protein|nr:hypothetical protein [Candidatus Methanoplasma sp.]
MVGSRGVSLEAIIEKLQCAGGVFKVERLEGEVLDEILSEEAGVDTSIGMPMDNRALAECLKRDTFLCVFCDYSFEKPEDHVMVMEDGNGNRVGHDVPEGMMGDFKDDPDAIWLCDDFVMFPSLATSDDLKIVMLPQSVTVIGEEDGAGSPVLLYPATTTDVALRRALGVNPSDPGIATAILAFDLL